MFYYIGLAEIWKEWNFVKQRLALPQLKGLNQLFKKIEPRLEKKDFIILSFGFCTTFPFYKCTLLCKYFESIYGYNIKTNCKC